MCVFVCVCESKCVCMCVLFVCIVFVCTGRMYVPVLCVSVCVDLSIRKLDIRKYKKKPHRFWGNSEMFSDSSRFSEISKFAFEDPKIQ